jgi:hypothetical protein
MGAQEGAAVGIGELLEQGRVGGELELDVAVVWDGEIVELYDGVGVHQAIDVQVRVGPARGCALASEDIGVG